MRAVTWQQWSVTVTLESPLALGGERPGGQPTRALDYLPGARLRGAAAAVLLADGRCPAAHRGDAGHCTVASCPVGTLFGGPGAARFGDGRPLDASDPLPRTAVSCEVVPGFATQRSAGSGHGVFDTMLDRVCWETLAPAGLVYAPRCPVRDCGERAERRGGWYARRAIGGSLTWTAVAVPTRLLGRVGVSRGRGAGLEESVHVVPVISAAYPDGSDPTAEPRVTSFQAEVLAPDDANGALLRDALVRIAALGGGQSTGLGAVGVRVIEATPLEPIAARLERFGRALATRRGQYARLAPLTASLLEGSYFSVDLRSDAQLRRANWAPTTVLDAEMLRSAAGVDDPTLTLVRAYAAGGWRSGWQMAWGLPRPAELAAQRGSCYLFRTGRLADWAPALERLELTGIGLHTAEGYGDVRVCDPFHLVLREQAV